MSVARKIKASMESASWIRRMFGTDLSFSLRGTILNSSYEPEFHEDRGALGTYPGVDIQFAPLPSSDESKIRAWVLQNLPRASGLS